MLDHYHSPRYQRYHLYKVLQVPPCDDGILVTPKAPRFVCAGRFVQLASKLQVPPAALALILNRRDGAFRRYWKIGTTEGSDGGSNWDEMRRGGFVSIGWKGTVPDLREHVIGMEEAAAKRLLRDMLHGSSTNAGVVTRKAGEIYNFATRIQDADLVLACEGQTVLGVGRVTGPYEYNDSLRFPHLRRVEWIELDTWRLPDNEGPRTTVYELGSYPGNLIELERRLASRRLGRMQNDGAPRHATQSREVPLEAPRPLDRITARIEAVLKRKSQVILYGPPGTGKTMHAVAAARELAARRNLGRAFSQLDAQSQQRCETKYVQTCTFHPGWSYEDFIEGLRPQVSGDAMVFTPRDGIFKNLCRDAAKDETSSYFLVIDEINRGDLPRIFGELMTTIETSKRGKEVTLPVTGKRFAVPANVFLIGTMNTADRSVSLMDTALRRRFGFIELMPDSKLFGKVDVGGLRLGPWLDALNQRLRARLKRDARNMQVGHAYLLPVPSSLSQFADIVRDDIIPLLEEYCYDDFHMLAEILGKNVVDVENACIREHLFDPEHERELVQALQFEEMQEAVLDQAPTLDLESDIDSDNDADESPAA
jgi:5-methylcytosine-specific restriction protein B